MNFLTMSTSESSDGSYLDYTASCSSSSESTPRIFMNNLAQPVQKLGPHIEILEQPKTHTLFGTKSYINGEKTNNVLPTYPTVQLVNYEGSAHIRCQLFQFDEEEIHPHQLKFHGQENQIEYLVPFNGSYKVYFEKLSFVTRSINSVRQELKTKYVGIHPNATKNEVNMYCKKFVKSINFHKVRLRFSAHDVKTDEEICHTYSRPILNSNNPRTNEPFIVRVTNLSGEARGGGETTLLVDKINKNIKVRFVDPDGGWSEMAHIVLKHRDSAIVCRIPSYKEKYLAHNVRVFIELVRETDGATSNRIPFTYIGRPHFALLNRKRKFPLPGSLAVSVADNLDNNNMESPLEIKKVCEVQVSQERWSPMVQIPMHETSQQLTLQDAPFLETAQNDQKFDSNGQNSDTDSGIQENGIDIIPSYLDILKLLQDSQFESFIENLSSPPLSEQEKQPEQLSEQEKQPEQLSEQERQPEQMCEVDNDSVLRNNPVLSQASVFTAHPARAPTDEMEIFNQHYENLHLPEYYGSDCIMNEFQDLIADSAPTFSYQLCSAQRRQPQQPEDSNEQTEKTESKQSLLKQKRQPTVGKLLMIGNIKELIKDIILLIKQNGSKSDLQTKLEHLLEFNLHNGDTVLHIAMNRPVFFVLVKTLHAVNMANVLNRANDLNQTVLHLAVLNELPDVVRMLISKGCDPMLADVAGNNAIHMAVTSYPTLAALINAMTVYKVPFDVNAANYENQTPLHVATMNDCEASLRLLLKSGADLKARDSCGRTVLHLAACHDRARAMSLLLDYIDAGDIDVTDSRGQTALQTACDSDIRENTLAIIQLLLEAKADPTKREGNTVSAMKLARRHPEMCKIILHHHHTSRLQDSDDEYLTADEGEHEDFIASELQGLKINELKCY